MAKRQSRRTVSLNRSVYEAAKLEAARRGQTLAGFVEFLLSSAGVPVAEHPRQTPTQVAHRQRAVARRDDNTAPRVPVATRPRQSPTQVAHRQRAVVRRDDASPEVAPVVEHPRQTLAQRDVTPRYYPSPERRMLGDVIADQVGFR